MNLADALDQLARETKRAKARLAYERAFAAAMPFFLALALWACAAMVGLHEALPLLIQSLTAMIALALMIWLFSRARRAFRMPTDAEAQALLAREAKLEAGAFEALDDRPVRYDPSTNALWRRAQDAARARARGLRAGAGKAKLNASDPYRLRYVALVVIACAAILGNVNAPDRLARAFIPDPGPLLGDQPMQVEAWVTPAAYTQAPPISLSDRLGEYVETPPSIEAMVRLTGPVGAPRLVFEGGGERHSVRFTRAADGAWEAQMRVPRAGALKIVRFHTRGLWRLRPADDARPRARFLEPIAFLPGENAHVAWAAEDDFGVSRLALRVRPVNPPKGLRNAPPVDMPLETPAGDPAVAEGAGEIALGPHPYAGMEVEARIVAFDALGQAGESGAMRITLPEKVFTQPLARASIEIRREILHERRPYRGGRSLSSRMIPAGDILLGNQRIELRDPLHRPPMRRAPDGVRHAARLLDTLTLEPQDGYFRDLAVFMGLKLARAELENAENIDETNIAAETLWLTALRAEYGGASDARLALEMARRELAQALRDGAPRERIEQLLEALREAAARYLQALVQEAVREGQQQTLEDTEERVGMTAQDLEQMFQEMERNARNGNTEQAQAQLEQLTEMLANLGVELSEQQEGGGEGGEQSEGQLEQSLDELAEAMGEQRQLNDETERQAQEGEEQQGGGQGEDGGQGGGGELAERQAQIRQQVGEAQEGADGAGAQGENLEGAQQAMREAEDALRRGDLEGARAAQEAALQAMRESSDAMAMQLRERVNAAEGQSGSSGPSDPLGRRISGANAGDGETEVPSEFTPARAREIMDEIRRRAQDQDRPEAEREYLRRLLDRFSGS